MGIYARQLVPLGAVVILLLAGSLFAYFEAVYLQDQAAEIGAADGAKITMWMWVFRAITAGMFVVALMLVYLAYKRLVLEG